MRHNYQQGSGRGISVPLGRAHQQRNRLQGARDTSPKTAGISPPRTAWKTWVREQTSSDTRLDFRTEDLRGRVWLTYKNNPGETAKEQTDLGLEWSKELTDHLVLNLKGNYVQKRTSEEVRLMDFLISSVYSRGKHKLTLTLEQQFNPDLLTSGSQEWRSVQRLPELKWEVSDLGLKSLPLRSQLVVGHYQETPSMVSKYRVYGQLTLASRTWRPRTGTSISYQGDTQRRPLL